MSFCSCFGSCFGLSKAQRREEERMASAEAREKAGEAAQRRQEEFEKSAAGRAARAQIAAAAKQSNAPNKGEPVLKEYQFGPRPVNIYQSVIQNKYLLEIQALANKAAF